MSNICAARAHCPLHVPRSSSRTEPRVGLQPQIHGRTVARSPRCQVRQSPPCRIATRPISLSEIFTLLMLSRLTSFVTLSDLRLAIIGTLPTRDAPLFALESVYDGIVAVTRGCRAHPHPEPTWSFLSTRSLRMATVLSNCRRGARNSPPRLTPWGIRGIVSGVNDLRLS